MERGSEGIKKDIQVDRKRERTSDIGTGGERRRGIDRLRDG